MHNNESTGFASDRCDNCDAHYPDSPITASYCCTEDE